MFPTALIAIAVAGLKARLATGLVVAAVLYFRHRVIDLLSKSDRSKR